MCCGDAVGIDTTRAGLAARSGHRLRLGHEVTCRLRTLTMSPEALRYDAVLLDIDGTLVDSNDAHAAAWSDAFAAYGRHHPPEQVRPLVGKGGDKVLQELASLEDES